MTRIAVVGGHGKVARHLHPLLVAAGPHPVALVRREDYRAELEGRGAEVRLLDIERRGRRRRSPAPSRAATPSSSPPAAARTATSSASAPSTSRAR